jgi:hypothetical protein
MASVNASSIPAERIEVGFNRLTSGSAPAGLKSCAALLSDLACATRIAPM